MENKKSDDIGALWLKTSKDGSKKYMSGTVTVNGVKINIVVFKNNNKKEDRHPDYNILQSKPMEQKQAQPEETQEEEVPF